MLVFDTNPRLNNDRRAGVLCATITVRWTPSFAAPSRLPRHWRSGAAVDGLHGPCAIETRAPGPDAALALNSAAGASPRRACGRRRGAGPRLVADPRRPAVHGRRAAPARPAGQSPGFGEAIAILAAFGSAQPRIRHARAGVRAAMAARLTALMSEAVGRDGLIGGQAADLLATDQPISFEVLERIHRGKTGALFSAAATAGARDRGRPRRRDRARSGVREEPRARVPDRRRPPRRRRESGGDRQGRSRGRQKTTFVSFSGVAGARQLAAELCRHGRISRWRRSADAPTVCASSRRSSRQRPLVSARPRIRGPARRRTAPAAAVARLSRRRRRSIRARVRDGTRAGRPRLRGSPASGSALLAAALLGPAAAIGVAARLPGLITGPRDAFVVASYLGVLLRRARSRRRLP